MAKYDISKKATEDLYNIWDYTFETWSEEQANNYYSILERAFEEIAATPFDVGKPFYELMEGLRAYHIRRHMIFYLVKEDGRVTIVRILHEKMNYIMHF